MEQNLFSITEITDEAIKQYGLSEYEDDKSSIRKQVERELNNRKVFTNETKTQYQSKKPVKAYSEKIKND
ncbi:MAG: hypothetical protein IKF58_16280, partial [Bacillus sp. (in: Bacteria)]|nr:hypothetical protein [Bacillus sp. (in: firmicutes)]